MLKKPDEKSPSGENNPTGLVVAHHGQRVRIKTGDGEIAWQPPRRQKWVVGDIVSIVNGRPKDALPRKNELCRESAHGRARQPLASNLDWLVVVTACGQAFKPGLVDRFIVAAGHSGMDVMIVLNKTDLPQASQDIESIAVYGDMGYAVHCVSALNGDGLETLADSLTGAVSAMVGHSGVGKTSLLNRLCPGVEREVGEIHEETERGRHTTSSSLLAPLPSGGGIIDSPGIRRFAPSGVEPGDVAFYFPGFAAWRDQCRFRDCLHLTEPGCAITGAVEEGALDRERYLSYRRLLASLDEESGGGVK